MKNVFWPNVISFNKKYVKLTELGTSCFKRILWEEFVLQICLQKEIPPRRYSGYFGDIPICHCDEKPMSCELLLVLTEVILPGHSFGTLLTSHNPQPCRCPQFQKQWTEHYLQALNWLFSLLKRTGRTTASLPPLTLKGDDKNIKTK